MRGENNYLLRHLKTVPTPWHHKVHNPGTNHRQDVIVDYNSNEICTIAPYRPDYTSEQYRRTINLITLAPELLAACLEFAMQCDSQGTLTQELADLILDAGGPDIRERVGQTAPKVSAPAPAQPTVNHKDNVSKTTVKKQRRLQG
jgi:hypothetical protein